VLNGVRIGETFDLVNTNRLNRVKFLVRLKVRHLKFLALLGFDDLYVK
jgi:hypothetical protein